MLLIGMEKYCNYITNKKKPDGDNNHQAFCLYKGRFTTIISSYKYGQEYQELSIDIETLI